MQNQNQTTQTGGNAATGGPNDAAPVLGQGLSGDIRRQKVELRRAERALRDLVVEANLADVPEAWRSLPSRSPDG
jgi:hypothetical protein